MKALVLVGCVLLAFGCASRRGGVSGSDIYPEPTHFADYARNEVELVRGALRELKFPVVEGTVSRILPRPLAPKSLLHSDYRPDQEKKGRYGGVIVEYWMNERYVLQVASAYYNQGGKRFTMEEWAVVMTRSERDRHSRPIYPGDFVFKIGH